MVDTESKAGGPPTSRPAMVYVVVPVYNEQEVVDQFYARFIEVIDGMPMDFRLLFVNDGSDDSTATALFALHQSDERVEILELSRNFGKEIALTAGLDHVDGDAAIVMDVDLQDPPELIPSLVEKWHEGYDVVYARRLSRQGDGIVKRFFAHMFYRSISRMTHVKIPKDTGDYRLLSRRAVRAVTQLREQHRFMKGLFAWIGFSQVEVVYHRKPRSGGRTKWSFWKLWDLAVEGFTSFTILPLKVATYLGLGVAFFSFAYATWVVIRTLLYGDPVAGYPSLMVVILFLGGVQLIAIGIVGQYLGRMFNETKRRPLYFVARHLCSQSTAGAGESDRSTM